MTEQQARSYQHGNQPYLSAYVTQTFILAATQKTSVSRLAQVMTHTMYLLSKQQLGNESMMQFRDKYTGSP